MSQVGIDKATYSALMFADRITFPHFSVSSASSLAYSAGESGSGALPRSVSPALILESARPALISRLSKSMISAGVLRGAPRALRPARLVARHEFGDRRDVRQRLDARRVAHAQRAKPTCPDVSDRGGNSVEGELYLTGDEVVQHRPRASIGYVNHGDAGYELEQLSRHMGPSPRSRATPC
jgi:hypothetical protein